MSRKHSVCTLFASCLSKNWLPRTRGRIHQTSQNQSILWATCLTTSLSIPLPAFYMSTDCMAASEQNNRPAPTTDPDPHPHNTLSLPCPPSLTPLSSHTTTPASATRRRRKNVTSVPSSVPQQYLGKHGRNRDGTAPHTACLPLYPHLATTTPLQTTRLARFVP